ncbi:2-dehydro-3-deoxygalactonokinase [Hydrocarboniphaga sp.]|uniref:2-dehydro-3-deoxygalactonokinase n=1 Tax=Hydrocarboniphaga sp. TaxID=2033016 RepID=UPI003D10E471
MIAIDWGTSSLRAYRLDARGHVVDQRRAPLGILRCEGRFEAVLTEQIGGWDDARIVLAGMIGSRQGWREAPYVECPAGLGEIAAGMVEVDAPTLPQRSISIVPGLCQPACSSTLSAVPDVMRGEEVQICGVLDELGPGTHTLCLPGTHNKWVSVHGNRITALRTAMTGEVFQVLCKHSILGKLMKQDQHDASAFERGLDAATSSGGLLHQLFGVRTLGLFGELAPEQSSSYLSGLLIGHEVRELAPPQASCVHIIGSGSLVSLYAQALQRHGIAMQAHDEACAATGMHRLAQSRWPEEAS